MSLADELTECLTVLLQHHFEPPLYFTCLSGNGMMVYGCYSAVPGQEDLHCEIRASIGSEEAFLVPIHILFVDQRGRAARVVLRRVGAAQCGERQMFLN
jgi:hypothetical protein